MGLSQDIEEAKEKYLRSPSIYLDSCGPNIVSLYMHSTKEPYLVEKSCRKSNLQDLETERSVISFCTYLQ